MKIFQSKFNALSGTDYKEIYPKAFGVFQAIKRKTKRKPFIRSVYFNKSKIFLDYFWEHLHQKSSSDRVRRLRYYQCSLDLIKNSNMEPQMERNPYKSLELLYRFAGQTKDKELFFVQIKENTKNDKKFFMSVFPK